MPETCPNCAAELPESAAFCPACGTPSDPTPSLRDDDRRHRLQRALGRGYRLGELLGRGGFGEVYAAHDVRLDRDVAVKTLRLDVTGSHEMTARFRREARAMAKLRHPHIVPVYALGDAEGLAYLIMPRIVGEGLRERLRREGPLAFSEVHRVMRELASALEAAHAAGVIHRDIKPDNILLEGDEQRVLLTDFGIARPAVMNEAPLTGTGVLLGTPHYMSPEQAAGEAEIGPASDIYSLGIVAFEMLTGHTPFHADSVLGLLARQLREDAPSPADLRPGCPPDVAAIVSRCLVRDIEGRWRSAGELLRALTHGDVPLTREPERVIPVAARPPLADATSAKRTPARRLRNAIALAFGVSLAAFGVDAVIDGTIDFAPFVAAPALLFLLLEYGAFSATRRRREAARQNTTSMSPVVQQAATDRAGIVSIATRLAATERAQLADVLTAVDRTVARAASLADRLEALDRALNAARRRFDYASTPSDAAAIMGVIERTIRDREQRATGEVESSRRALEDELEQCVTALHEVRVMLGRDGAPAAQMCLDRLGAGLAMGGGGRHR